MLSNTRVFKLAFCGDDKGVGLYEVYNTYPLSLRVHCRRTLLTVLNSHYKHGRLSIIAGLIRSFHLVAAQTSVRLR